MTVTTANAASRPAPAHSELVELLRRHLELFGTAPDGRLFNGIRGGVLPTITYRHACFSTRLNGGVPPTQVAERAGHSADMLLRIYAKCLVGQDELARWRIIEALRDDDATPEALA